MAERRKGAREKRETDGSLISISREAGILCEADCCRTRTGEGG